MFRYIMPKKQRLMELDVLRGIAIMLVLGYHPVIPSKQSGFLRPITEVWQHIGWSGVDLFFVLSGFLIGGLLFNELRTRGSLDVRRFLIRRGFKIWPLYYIYIFYLIIGQMVVQAKQHSALDYWSILRPFVPNLLNVQNYLGTPCVHTWSLAVEEHFYIVLPCVLLWATASARRRAGRVTAISAVPVMALCLMVLCSGLRWFTNKYFEYNLFTHDLATHLRIDSLFFGVFLVYLVQFHPNLMEHIRRHRRAVLLLGLALISPMLLVDPGTAFAKILGLALVYWGYGCILLAFVYTPSGSGWMSRFIHGFPGRALAFIGVFSYPIYLWHPTLALAPVAKMVASGWLMGFSPTLRWVCVMTVYIVLATAVGIVMSLLVERPMLKLRDRLFPSRAEHMAEPAQARVRRPNPASKTT